MNSTLTGKSGRRYTLDRMLRKHPWGPDFDIHLGLSEQRKFILKPVVSRVMNLAHELKAEFENESRLRNHVDEVTEKKILVYEYFKDDLLSFIQRHPGASIQTRKQILNSVGYALKTLHSKGWAHLDVKPNNILLDWHSDASSEIRIDSVALGDLDCAHRLDSNGLVDKKLGNFMWRSPEGQAGRGVSISSEVFSFGLVCLYTITGLETMHPDVEQLKTDGVDPDLVVLYKMFLTLGPAPPALITVLDDKYWEEIFVALSEEASKTDESERFENWPAGIFPNLDYDTKKFILKIVRLDPAERASMDEIMQDSWWQI